MKQIRNIIVLLALSLTTAVACHNKEAQDNTAAPAADTSVSNNTATAPVQISPDDSLQKGVTDATKDYPGVNASVSNGEITLTGNIQRNRLTGLMQSLHSLHPKKINNNLTIK